MIEWSSGSDPAGPSCSSGEEPSAVLLMKLFCELLRRRGLGLMTPCGDFLMFPTFSVRTLTSAPEGLSSLTPGIPWFTFCRETISCLLWMGHRVSPSWTGWVRSCGIQVARPHFQGIWCPQFCRIFGTLQMSWLNSAWLSQFWHPNNLYFSAYSVLSSWASY